MHMFTQKKAMGFTLKFECIESYLNENFVTELLRRRLGLIYKEKGGGEVSAGASLPRKKRPAGSWWANRQARGKKSKSPTTAG